MFQRAFKKSYIHRGMKHAYADCYLNFLKWVRVSFSFIIGRGHLVTYINIHDCPASGLLWSKHEICFDNE